MLPAAFVCLGLWMYMREGVHIKALVWKSEGNRQERNTTEVQAVWIL